MNRRLLTILLPLGAATLAAGCTTFSDNDAVARVGDVELSDDSLRDRFISAGVPDDQDLPADAVRQEIGRWIREETAKRSDPSKAPDAYAKGLGVSGTICIQLAVVEGRETVDAIVTELEAGADFDVLHDVVNIDPSLTNGGRLGCNAAADLPIGQGNPLVDSLPALNAEQPFAVAQLPTDPGQPEVFTLSRFVPYDELSPEEGVAVAVNLTAGALGLDVHVDPRYGVYESSTGTIVPLG